MKTIFVGDFVVHIERKPNKNLYLRVESDGSVKATVPTRTAEATIIRFVEERADWLHKQQLRQQNIAEKNEIMLTDAHRDYLKAVLPPRIAYWEDKLGVTVKEWRIRKMKTRWGTCNYREGRVWFALMLALQPLDLIDYIVLHELTHLIEPSHNKRFQVILCQHMPDWKDRRKRLNGGL